MSDTQLAREILSELGKSFTGFRAASVTSGNNIQKYQISLLDKYANQRYEQGLRDMAERVKGESFHYLRECSCGNSWLSLHCKHDGIHSSCPQCGMKPVTRGKDCNCQFHITELDVDQVLAELTKKEGE